MSERKPRITDAEYNRIYDKIYIRLKMRGLIIDRGGRDYLDQYAEGYMDGVEAALQEVTLNERDK